MATYPLPGFHFQVEWGGTRIGFTEVSGLSIDVEVIEYREGADAEYAPRKMPGRVSYGDIALKRGIVEGDGEFFAWLNTIQLNKVERRNVTISLLNENHEPVMVWKAVNAFPRRLEGPFLHASDGEVAIETLVLAHEGLRVETP
jgi:phage tail-like protein